MNQINDYKVWTALITPFNEDGSIDFSSLNNLLKLQQGAGNGITLLGSTGEALNMTADQRKEIVEFVCKQNLDVPLMVGCGSAVLSDQINWISYLNTKPIQAILLATPMYAKPGDHGQYEWFKALFDVSKFPVCLYNIPGRAAASLSLDAFAKLSSHKNFWALKEASGSVADFIAYKNAASNCHMLSGDDPMFAEFSRNGAKGVISVAGNVWPGAVQKVANQITVGNFENEELYSNASKALFSASNPVPVKALAKAKGIIPNAIVLPPLSKDDMGDLGPLAKFDQQLQAI